jgi:3-oxoacyl-[acyl-carrier protein] reductase
VAGEVKERGGEAMAVVGDVSSSRNVQAAVKQAIEAYGHIDILVNCAAISDRSLILEISEEEWRRVLDITLTGTFLCSQYVAKQMVAQGKGGTIVNIAATGVAIKGSIQRIAYDTAKAGVMSLTHHMAVQLAPHRIRVNAVAPGPTGSQVGGAIPAEKRSFKNLHGRLGTPSDQAKAVLFLASDDSEHIYGQVLHVDGGISVI